MRQSKMTSLDLLNLIKRAANGDNDAWTEFVQVMKPIVVQTPKIMSLRDPDPKRRRIDPHQVDQFVAYVLHTFMQQERTAALDYLHEHLFEKEKWENTQTRLIDWVEQVYYFWRGQQGDKKYFGFLTLQHDDYVKGWIRNNYPVYSDTQLDAVFDRLTDNMGRWGNPQSFFAFPTYLIESAKNVIHEIHGQDLATETRIQKQLAEMSVRMHIRLRAAECLRLAGVVCFDIILYDQAKLFDEIPEFGDRLDWLKSDEDSSEFFERQFGCSKATYYRRRKPCLLKYKKCTGEEKK